MVKPAEIQAGEKQHEVDGSAHGAEVWRLHGARPHQRDGDIGEVEVILHAAADEKRAGKKLTVFPGAHGNVNSWQSDHDDAGDEVREHELLLSCMVVRGAPDGVLVQGTRLYLRIDWSTVSCAFSITMTKG